MPKSPKLTQKQTTELKTIINGELSTSKETRKAQAVFLLDKEKDITEITDLTGYERARIFELRTEYLSTGVSALQDKRQGKPKEILSSKQRAAIIQTIKTKKPTDVGYRTEYWTTGLLGLYIKKIYKVQYKSKTSYYLLFKASSFTYHKPGRVYQNRDEQEVAQWRKANGIKVKQALEDPHTIILTEDEMVLSSQTTFQKIWLPKGEYPKIECSNTKQNRSIYGFLNIKTGQEHAFKTEWQNMHITAKILGKIRKLYPTQKILLLWDGPGWHKGSKVQEFLKNDGNMDVIHFPKYSPEENPQEHVWKEGRSHVTHNRTINDIDETADEFVRYLNKTTFSYSLLGFSLVS